ncbi:MAG: esterase-like activity of phytase family protein [Henriciella sp.]|uniref:esterase-like activity of phytase family protein n=1 Tax=Henriciella sp. TaxID=1968823 RepID=UPI003C7096CA
MKLASTIMCASLLLAGAGCRGSVSEPVASAPDAVLWSFADRSAALKDASCPDGAGRGYELSTLITVDPVPLGEASEVSDALKGMAFRGGWALSAPLASFGGLSGLDVLPGGDLLAVSDSGSFVQIGFDQQAVQPTGQATIAFMQDAEGTIVSGKENADAEGLAYRDGLALVSFERNHRVLAFDYAACGSNARGIEVASIDSRPETLGRSIRGNAGAEALTLDGDALMLGLETVARGAGPTAMVDENGQARFDQKSWLETKGVPLVGMDATPDALFSLQRAYNPLTGNTIYVRHTDAAGTRLLAKLEKPLAVDNFEGIAVETIEGSTRIFLIADDNFSDDQRTLLFVFELNSQKLD